METENWEIIKDVLMEALNLHASERREFLEKAGITPEIRAEVESLLAYEEESEDLMRLSAVEFSKDFFDDDNQNALIGQQIGVYKIIGELGYGGMGAVYLAERADGKFKQKVALKLLKREMNTAALRRRFQQEREILASLEHPNIARLLDAGTTDDKIPFIAMEYVEGLPIDEYCNIQKLNLNQRLDLFRKVCSTVNFAHRNLIVHRDLKPSNILVNDDGNPKLLDFGISKILSAEFEQINSATVTKLGVMTPGYASPEQLQNKSVTTATDIYSLGVILYELLSGHRPFENKEGELKEIYKAVLENEPLPPSVMIDTISKNFKEQSEAETEIKYSDREHNVVKSDNNTESNKTRRTMPNAVNLSSNSLRGDLDNIVLKALRKEPERRYLSAENFAEDIQRHQRGLPVTARPNTFSYRAEKFIKRNSLAVGAGLLILLTLIGGIVTTLWQARRAEAQRVRAENRFNDVRNLANSFLFEITPEIENLSGSTRAKELLVVRALEYLDRLSNETSNDLTLQRELAAAYEKVGNVQGNPFQANIGNMQGALDSYEKARTIREALFAKDPNSAKSKTELAKNSQLIGDVLFNSGEIAKAGEQYRKALEAQTEIVGRDPENTAAQFDLALARFALGSTFFWNSQYDDALGFYRPAQETFERMHAADPNNDVVTDKLANSYIRIGESVGWQDDLDGEFKNFQIAVALIEPVVQRNPRNAGFRKTLWLVNMRTGDVYLAWEKYDKCLESYRKALELAKMNAEDLNNAAAKRDLALSYNKVGDVLDSSGDGKAAFEHSEQALKLQQEIAAADPKNFEIRRQIAGTHKRMGYAQTTMKDHAGSRRSFQNALGQYENLAASDPNDKKIPREIAIVSQTIGKTYIAAAEESDKKANLQNALEWDEKSHKLLLELKANGTLPEFDNKLITEIETEIAEIKAKLAKI
jgi:eukaryotic-like serine/threonine-protein kinase